MLLKKFPLMRLLLFNFSCIIILSCSQNVNKDVVNIESEIDSVRSAIHASISWAKNKDFQLLYSTIANDSNYLEVDPGPGLIKGFEEFKRNEVFWGSPDFKTVRYEIRDLIINFSKKGDVAWFYCILDDENEWKGQPASWINTRWTGVLEKRDGRWNLVQSHFSFAKEL